MNGEAEAPDEAPVEWSVWPPPKANRETRRSCRHDYVKKGYCTLCGTRTGAQP